MHYSNIEKDNKDFYIRAQYNLGFLYNNQKKFNRAIMHYSNIKKEDDTEVYFRAQHNLALLYHKQEKFDKAEKHFKNIEKEKYSEHIYASAQYNLGLLYYEQGNNKEAENCWSKNINNNDGNIYNKAQFNLSILYYKQGNNKENDSNIYNRAQFNLSILNEDAEKCLDNIISTKNKTLEYYKAKLNKGVLYFYKNNCKEAENNWDEIINDEFDEKICLTAKYFKGLLYEKNSNKAIEHWLDFIQKDNPYYDDILLELLDYCSKNNDDKWLNGIKEKLNEFFLYKIIDNIIELDSKNNKQSLIEILKSFITIRNLLQVNKSDNIFIFNNNFETKVAHYTTTDTAKILLEQKNKFRIFGMSRTNDPTEGKVIYDYFNEFLKDKNIELKKSEDDWAGFLGCFTFNHDSLNQFRLYGKENNQEASGVSIVVNFDFFSESSQNVMGESLISNIFYYPSTDNEILKLSQNTLTYKQKDKRLPLYRCIYLDPESFKTKKSTYLKVAHRNEITFYREKGRNVKDWGDIYQKNIKYIEEEVKKELKNMLDVIQKCYQEKDCKEIIDLILLQLSCFVKHAAFEEEQECRIIRFIQFNGDEADEIKRDSDAHKIYFEYEPIADKIDRIYLSPYAKDKADYFRSLGIKKVKISKNPFRS